MQPFRRYIKKILIPIYALPLPEGRAGIAWAPSKPEI
jgi:hypothetical protein